MKNLLERAAIWLTVRAAVDDDEPVATVARFTLTADGPVELGVLLPDSLDTIARSGGPDTELVEVDDGGDAVVVRAGKIDAGHAVTFFRGGRRLNALCAMCPRASDARVE